MLKGAVARRYAEAVFDLGVQQDTLDRWLSDLRLIAEAFGNRRLAFILRQPRIPFARKEAIVRDLLAQQVTQEALALAILLVERELVDLGPKVAEAFEQLLNDYRGQAIAIVTSAAPLEARQQEEVAAYLHTLTGKQITLETRVDPSILGGIIAQIGDTLLDGSVRRRLAILREQIIRGGAGGPDDGARPAPLGNGHGPDTPAAPTTPAAPAAQPGKQQSAGQKPAGQPASSGKSGEQQSAGQSARRDQPPGKPSGNKQGNGNQPRR